MSTGYRLAAVLLVIAALVAIAFGYHATGIGRDAHGAVGQAPAEPPRQSFTQIDNPPVTHADIGMTAAQFDVGIPPNQKLLVYMLVYDDAEPCPERSRKLTWHVRSPAEGGGARVALTVYDPAKMLPPGYEGGQLRIRLQAETMDTAGSALKAGESRPTDRLENDQWIEMRPEMITTSNAPSMLPPPAGPMSFMYEIGLGFMGKALGAGPEEHGKKPLYIQLYAGWELLTDDEINDARRNIRRSTIGLLSADELRPAKQR